MTFDDMAERYADRAVEMLDSLRDWDETGTEEDTSRTYSDETQTLRAVAHALLSIGERLAGRKGPEAAAICHSSSQNGAVRVGQGDRVVSVGETAQDLQAFDPGDFAKSLMGL